MTKLLKWDGDALYLGRTKMAEVASFPDEDHPPMIGPYHRYMIGPDDFTSTPYQRKEDARQDCERHVRQLLKAAGAGEV